MRPTPFVHGVLVCALLLAGAAVPAFGQEPDPNRDRPVPFRQAQLAAIANDMGDAAVNAVVFEAVRNAAGEDGIQARRAPRELSLPEPDAIQAARDFGESDFELDAIVLSGLSAADTIDVARDYQSTVYIGVGQGIPCVAANGIPDPSETCEGDAPTLVRNYRSSAFEVDQAGYLAGIVAASVARNGRVGAIGGYPACVDCNRYIESFERGVASVSPNTDVVIGYLTDGDPDVANTDTETGRAYAEAFIDINQLDVVLAASGGSSPGVIQAACDAGVLAIGTDIDRARAHPRLARCTVTSAMRDYEAAIENDIFTFSRAVDEGDVLLGGGTQWDLSNDGVRLAPFSEAIASTLPVELATRLQEATDAIIAGTVETCSESCGTVEVSEDAAADAEPVDGSDPSASPAADDTAG